MIGISGGGRQKSTKGWGQDWAMSSKSSKRSMFDLYVGIGSGFLVGLVALVGMASSSEMSVSESDSVSSLVFLVGAIALNLDGGVACFGFDLAAATILIGSGSESRHGCCCWSLTQSPSWNLSLTWLLLPLQVTCGLWLGSSVIDIYSSLSTWSWP